MSDQPRSVPLSKGAVPSIHKLSHADWVELVKERVMSLDYGVVQILVHGGQVVQIERTERHRFPSA